MGRGYCRAPAHGCAHRGLQLVHSATRGCGTAYMVKGPTARCTWRGMMLRRSTSSALQLSPWYMESVSSRAILEGGLRASRLNVPLWMPSVMVLGPALMRWSRLF